MAKLYNLAAMTVANMGSGPITLGTAATVGGVLYLSFAAAGATNGETIAYSINDIGQSEQGTAVYSSVGPTITRTPVTSTNGNAPINVSGAAIVRISPARADIANLRENNTFTSPAVSTSPATGAQVFTGGVGIGGALNVAGNISGGSLLTLGGFGFGFGSSTYNILVSPDGVNAVQIGAAQDKSNYYSNDRHVFFNRAGTTLASLDTNIFSMAVNLTVSKVLSAITIDDTSSVAVGVGGLLNLQGVSASGATTYSAIKAYATNGTAGIQAGDLQVLTMTGGVLTNWGRFTSTGNLLFRSGGTLAVSATTGTQTLLSGTYNIVGDTLAQTLTNKTLVSPAFTFGTGSNQAITFQSVNTGFFNQIVSQNGGTVSNAATVAAFAASLSAGASTSASFGTAGGAFPTGFLNTGSGLTGGFGLNVAAGNLSLASTAGQIAMFTGGAQRVWVTNDGIGVGGAPASTVTIQANGTAPQARMLSTGGTDTRISSTGTAGIVGTYSNNDLVFFQNGAEAGRFDTSKDFLAKRAIYTGTAPAGYLYAVANNAGVLPNTVMGGGAIGWNFSTGVGEVTNWNLYTAAGVSFSWRQMTSPTASTELMQLSPAGLLTPTAVTATNGLLTSLGNLGGLALPNRATGLTAWTVYSGAGELSFFNGANRFSVSSLGVVGFFGSTSGNTSITAAAVASGNWTLPSATDTFVGKATTDTLTNKTLTNPVINGASPAVSGAIGFTAGLLNWYDGASLRSAVAADTVQTLTNKTISGSSNTITNIANGSLSAMAAFTFKGNNTGGSAAPTDVSIAALTTKAAPANGDFLMLSDQAASGAWKKATLSSLPGGILTVGTTPVLSGTSTAPLFNNAGVLGNGSISSVWSTFTQTGTGTASVTLDSLLRNRVFTPEMFGAVSGGPDCTAAFVNMAAALNAIGGGVVVNFAQNADYKIWPAGAAPAAIPFQLTSVRGVTFNFNGAKISTNNAFGWGSSPYIFYMNHVSDLIFNNPWYDAPNAATNPPSPSDGGGFITIYDTAAPWSENVHIFNAKQNGGQAFFQTGYPTNGDLGGDAKNFSIINAAITNVFYAMNFQANGDNFFARGIHITNTGRAYFPWNVSNHDVEIIGDGSVPGFVSVQLKTYGTPQHSERRRNLSNIKMRYRDSSPATPSGFASSIDFQQSVPQVNVIGSFNNGAGLVRLNVNTTANMATGQVWFVNGVGGSSGVDLKKWTITVIGPGHVDLQGSTFAGAPTGAVGYLRVPAEIKNIDIELDITGRPNVAVAPAFVIQKNNQDGSADTTTDGYTVENVTISGSIRNYNSGTAALSVFSTAGGGSGTWTNERLRNINLRNLTIEGTSTAAFVDATNVTNLILENIWSTPTTVPWTLTGANSSTQIINTSATGLTNRLAAFNMDVTNVVTANTVNTSLVVANTVRTANVPKAWAYYTNSGTTYTFVAGSNIASLTRSSTGLLVITLTIPFATANYAVLATSDTSARLISAFPNAANNLTVSLRDIAGNPADYGFSFTAFGV